MGILGGRGEGGGGWGAGWGGGDGGGRGGRRGWEVRGGWLRGGVSLTSGWKIV